MKAAPAKMPTPAIEPITAPAIPPPDKVEDSSEGVGDGDAVTVTGGGGDELGEFEPEVVGVAGSDSDPAVAVEYEVALGPEVAVLVESSDLDVVVDSSAGGSSSPFSFMRKLFTHGCELFLGP